MNAWSEPRPTVARLRLALALVVALAGGGAGQGAWAAPPRVEPFDAHSWQALHARLKRPAVVVFTSTDCTHCPAALKQVRQYVQRQRVAATVMAVVMDVAPGDDDAALLQHPPYRETDRLAAFAGQAGALQYSVNPAWRGVTPYVALLLPGRPPRFVAGIPSPDDLDPWGREAARFTPAR